MSWRPKGWILIGMLLTVMSTAGLAQIATTQVADTVYHANGTPATGTVVISWPAFTTSAGDAVASGNTSAAIGVGGALSVQLTPNAGAIPVGTYYTVVFHLDDGSVTREYWVVPVSSSAVKISAIESTVLPTTVAMQTVTKNYVDTAIAAAVEGHPVSGTPYVVKSGDTMTGPLNLAGDPTSALQAADKSYVDASVTALTSGLGQKVTTLPTGTQTVTQPAGTELDVNRMNGVAYASQYATYHGTNGIANAMSSPDCVAGCDIKVDRGYVPAENYWLGLLNSGTHLMDARGGSEVDSFVNPLGANSAGLSVAQKIDMISTLNATTLSQSTGSSTPASIGLMVRQQAFTGGSNMLPAGLETPPYFKMAYSAASIEGSYNAQGQHGLLPESIACFGVGDCLLGSRYITASGGSRDESDEGAHLYDTIVQEDNRVFQGTCISNCTTGSTSLLVRQDVSGGTQGEGRFLIDKNPAKTYSSATTGGSIVGGGNDKPHASVQFSGTNFPISVFLSLAQTIVSQGGTMAPGTVSVPIATTGVPSGYVTNTGAIGTSSGIACVADQMGSYYEMAPFTVVDGTHLQMTLNKPHAVGATIAVGGLCGYGVEQVADTQNGIRQVFPVVGSYSPTALYYESLASPVLGQMNQTDAFLNVNAPISSLTRAGGVVKVVTSGPLPYDLNGLTVTIAGASDASFNGTFPVTTTGANSFTYAQGGGDATASGGAVQYLNGGFVIYPMAEVLNVYNAASRTVDGTMTLAPNTAAWAANDPVEQPHWFQEDIWADQDLYQQTVPRPTIYTRAGLMYGGNNSGSMYGWSIENLTSPAHYFGYGGTHTIPVAAYESQGVWQHDMNLTAGEQSVFTVYCNLHGCGNWNSGYDLFQLQDPTGYGYMHYAPQTSTLSVNLRGTNFAFTPAGMMAGTLFTGPAVANHDASSTGVFASAGVHDAELQGMNTANSRAAFVLSTNYQGNYNPTWEFGTDVNLNGTKDYYIYNYATGRPSIDIAPTDDVSIATNVKVGGVYQGPATAPTGGCSVVGWVFSQDGHASFCNGSTWQLKI